VNNSVKPASAITSKLNQDALSTLPMADMRDFEAANRGFIGKLTPCVIKDASGRVVWNNDQFDFVSGDAPESVNPSLWRQSTLNSLQGLFEVVPGIYQARGFDMSNVTFVEGKEGVIVIDPLISNEPAAAALALYREHRGDRRVTSVIYTHSHIDHFGGVKGVITQEDVDAGKVSVIAPEGFLEHAVSENVYAGTAMGRRAGYMYGASLPRDIQGGVGTGLGQSTSTGTVTLIAPTLIIAETGHEEVVDGVRIVFQMAPGTEAPSEMHFYFPDFKALCMAENATHTMHNILTLRGAVVRDAHAWSSYLTEAIDMFGADVEVAFASHHWPTWGKSEIIEYLELQRDLYSYLHDQTLRMMNKGMIGIEIAEDFKLPPALENAWHAHGYYGSVSHNVKAIYQRYMGWYTGNPAQLWEHTPTDAGKRYLEFMGGADAVVEKAKPYFESGDYRWVAEVLNHIMFAEPDHQGARELLADTYEQLGYGIENATWRNAYLSGAYELRNGSFGTPIQSSSPDMLGALTVPQFLDAVAIRVDGPRAWGLTIAIDLKVTDLDVVYRISLRNGVLVYSTFTQSGETEVTISMPKAAVPMLLLGNIDALEKAGVQIAGDKSKLETLFSVLEAPDPDFAIVTP
jgi:alkyl sulfatase BDS1-like metallo-beta-lactamase superfamily hydrolase